MKILYGVQGTGNGHLTRALAMAKVFPHHPQLKVDFLISGRDRSQLFGVEALGDYRWYPGLSFATRDGKISLLDTISHNPWWRFWQDVHDLDLSDYDLVITDFEPVSAWAAKRQGKRCIGLSRQYAFYRYHPALPTTALQRAMIKQFAPCDVPLGTHWCDLGCHSIPPLIEPSQPAQLSAFPRYLVYLPFQPLAQIESLIESLSDYQFDVFHPQATAYETPNAVYSGLSRHGFRSAFNRACGVLTNAGFGTASEALASGKRLLVKPLKGQFEQQANAHCLVNMGLGSVTSELKQQDVLQWLKQDKYVTLQWPDVAATLGGWLANGATEPVAQLSRRLWQATLRMQVA